MDEANGTLRDDLMSGVFLDKTLQILVRKLSSFLDVRCDVWANSQRNVVPVFVAAEHQSSFRVDAIPIFA